MIFRQRPVKIIGRNERKKEREREKPSEKNEVISNMFERKLIFNILFDVIGRPWIE